MGRVLRISIYELTNRSTMYDRSIGVRGGGGGGGGRRGSCSPQKNLKLKSWANFEHKLGKNLRNKAIHLNDERAKKGKVKAMKAPSVPAIYI